MDIAMRTFIEWLAKCGISESAIIAITSVVTEEPTMKEMCRRLVAAYDRGEEIRDSLALQILVDMMKEADSLV